MVKVLTHKTNWEDIYMKFFERAREKFFIHMIHFITNSPLAPFQSCKYYTATNMQPRIYAHDMVRQQKHENTSMNDLPLSVATNGKLQ